VANCGWRDVKWRLDDSDSGGVDKKAVTFSLVHHLRVTGDQSNAGAPRSSRHTFDHGAEGLHRQAFLENETGAQVKRPRPTHREVVHGTVHGQVTNIPAGKDERAHDIRIGGERQARAVQAQHRAIVTRLERFIGKCR